MASQQAQTISAKISRALKQDPKKALVLSVLFALLLGMWGKMFLGGGRNTPKSAAAMPPAPMAPSGDSQKARAKSADRNALLRDWLDQPLPQKTTRNLFELKMEYFPMDGSRPTESSRTEQKDPTFWDRLAKSIDAQADQQHKREILIANLRQQAAAVDLTSTVMGPRPKAMINGVMVGEGQVVAQFRVLKIESRSVVVEREGIKLEIPMK
jgi:hypothetical protein